MKMINKIIKMRMGPGTKYLTDDYLTVEALKHYRRGYICVTIMNVQAVKKTRGAFTAFLSCLEDHAKIAGIEMIFMDTVIHARFRNFLERKGFREWPIAHGNVPSMYKLVGRRTGEILCSPFIETKASEQG